MYNLTVELHNGICWYVVENKEFSTKQEAEKYYHKNYHRDNSTWYLTKI